MRYLLLILILCLFSCNTALLVNKSKVVHETQGYLLFYHGGRCLFIPDKDTSIANFVKSPLQKKGYLLDRAVCGLDGLKILSKKFEVNMVYMDKKQEFTLPDSIYLTTTSFKYVLNSSSFVDFSDIVEFEYNGKRYEISTSDSFYGEILKFPGNTM